MVYWIIGKGNALTRRKYVRHGQWSIRVIVEERVRLTEPAHPPAEKRWYTEGDEAERTRRRRVRRERSYGGALEDSAKRRAEQLISGTAISIMVHERMNEANNWKARAGSVADWAPATISVPAEDHVREVQATHGVCARGKLHAARWHMEYICSAGRIEHIWSFEEARKCLAVLAVADETEAGVRSNFVRDAAHVAAPAAERKIL